MRRSSAAKISVQESELLDARAEAQETLERLRVMQVTDPLNDQHTAAL